MNGKATTFNRRSTSVQRAFNIQRALTIITETRAFPVSYRHGALSVSQRHGALPASQIHSVSTARAGRSAQTVQNCSVSGGGSHVGPLEFQLHAPPPPGSVDTEHCRYLVTEVNNSTSQGVVPNKESIAVNCWLSIVGDYMSGSAN